MDVQDLLLKYKRNLTITEQTLNVILTEPIYTYHPAVEGPLYLEYALRIPVADTLSERAREVALRDNSGVQFRRVSCSNEGIESIYENKQSLDFNQMSSEDQDRIEFWLKWMDDHVADQIPELK